MTTQEAYEEWLEIMNLPPLPAIEAEIWRRAYNCGVLNTELSQQRDKLDQANETVAIFDRLK